MKSGKNFFIKKLLSTLSSQPKSSDAKSSVEAKLGELHQKGLISDAELATQRQRILDQI